MVDDNSATIGLMKEVLYAGGATSVETAHDGEEAIDMLQRFRPNLLVTDWQMPRMNGLALTRIIRGAVIRPDTRIANSRLPIVLVSGHASTRAVEEARRSGVDEFVVKPFSVSSLLRRLSAATNRPRPFIVAEGYIGPDRRRRGGLSKGRRVDDPPKG